MSNALNGLVKSFDLQGKLLGDMDLLTLIHYSVDKGSGGCNKGLTEKR